MWPIFRISTRWTIRLTRFQPRLAQGPGCLLPCNTVAEQFHEHQGLADGAHAHALGDGVPQALVGGGGGRGHDGDPGWGETGVALAQRGPLSLLSCPPCSRFQSAALPQARRAVIRFDPLKRLRTLEQRGLDFLDAERVFAGPTLEFEDRRRDYGEDRTVCLGLLDGRMVLIIYTQRSFFRQIISMRKANAKKQLRFRHHFS